MLDDKNNNFELLNKYQKLLIENANLKAENKKLKEQIDILTRNDENIEVTDTSTVSDECVNSSYLETHPENTTTVNQKSKPDEKIKLFMSLFKGRADVYAKRWQNKNGASGYSPVCSNEWKPGICDKPPAALAEMGKPKINSFCCELLMH